MCERMPTKSLFIGKETLSIKPEFFEKSYFMKAINQLGSRVTEKVLPYIRQSFDAFILLACHGDYVYSLPEEATLFASSKRCQIEIWGIREQVLCIQSHPEFNAAHIQQNIIDKRYDCGLLDDQQKKEAESLTYNT